MQPSNVHPETMRKTQAANAGRELLIVKRGDVIPAGYQGPLFFDDECDDEENPRRNPRVLPEW